MSLSPSPPKFAVCSSEALAEGSCFKFRMVFEGREDECFIVRFEGRIYAYINRCVHMPRRLDCEADRVFDRTGRYLRCSMHGIVYTPETGRSLSAMCEGEQLRAIAVYEENGEVGIADFRVGAASSGNAQQVPESAS